METVMEPQFSVKFNGLLRTAERNCPYSVFKKLPSACEHIEIAAFLLRYSCMVETNSKDAVSPVRIVEAVDTGFPSISHR